VRADWACVIEADKSLLQQGWFNYLGFVCGLATINNIGANIIATMVVLNTGPGGEEGYVASKEVVLAFMAALYVLQVGGMNSF
jgi:hypothetical protein